MNKQEQMMRLFDTMNEIRPEGKGGRPPHERPHHGEGHHGRPHHGRGTVECGCKHEHGHGECNQEGGHKPPREERLHPSGKKLLCILLQEEKLNQRNIAGMMNISAQAVSDLVKKMEHREFILKEQGEINNENMISLTEKGREVAQQADAEIKEHAEKLFQGFSEEEMETLQELVEKLRANIK